MGRWTTSKAKGVLSYRLRRWLRWADASPLRLWHTRPEMRYRKGEKEIAGYPISLTFEVKGKYYPLEAVQVHADILRGTVDLYAIRRYPDGKDDVVGVTLNAADAERLGEALRDAAAYAQMLGRGTD